MLTVEDVKNVSFRRANFGGYKPEDVDAFIDDVQVAFEEITRERDELASTVKSLNSKIEKFYEEDNSIRKVILEAQKIAEKTMGDAKVKTTAIINKAVEKSEDMINAAKKEVSAHTEISNRLKLESARLRNQLEDIYKKHIEIINKIPCDSSNVVEASDYEAPKEIIKIKPHVKEKTVDESQFKHSVNDLDDMIAAGVTKKDFLPRKELGVIDTQRPHLKFKNLKFGKNIDSSDEDGIYSGIFK